MGARPGTGHCGIIESLERRRLLAAGDLDASFASAGTLAFDARAANCSMAVQGDGKVLLAGRLETDGKQSLLVTRLNPDGSFDSTFADRGSYRLAESNGFILGNASVALQSD